MAAYFLGRGQNLSAEVISLSDQGRIIDPYACVSNGRARISTLAQSISPPDRLSLSTFKSDIPTDSNMKNRTCIRCSGRSAYSIGVETLATPQQGPQEPRGKDRLLVANSWPRPGRWIPFTKMCHAEDTPSATAGEANILTFGKRAALAAGASLLVLISFGSSMDALAAVGGDEQLYRSCPSSCRMRVQLLIQLSTSHAHDLRLSLSESEKFVEKICRKNNCL